VAITHTTNRAPASTSLIRERNCARIRYRSAVTPFAGTKIRADGVTYPIAR
jgi:hypothetical protein